MTLDNLSAALVKSPKRAVQRMMKRLNSGRDNSSKSPSSPSKRGAKQQQQLDIKTLHIPDMDNTLDPTDQLSESFSVFDVNSDDAAGPQQHKDSSSTSKRSHGLSPVTKRKSKVCVPSSNNNIDGYSSDGVLNSKRKKEKRPSSSSTSNHSKKTPKSPKSPKSGRRASLRSKLASLGGSDRSIKSAGAASVPAGKRRASTKADKVASLSNKDINKNKDKSSSNSSSADHNATTPKSRKNSLRKALLSREGSERSVKSSSSTRKRRTTSIKKKSGKSMVVSGENEDDAASVNSSKSCVSCGPAVGGKKRAGKKKKADKIQDGDDDDESQRSSRSSTSSTKVKRASSKKSKSTKKKKSVRGGKRTSTVIPPAEPDTRPQEDADYHSDGQMSLASTLSSKPSLKEKRGRRRTPVVPIDDMDSPGAQKLCLSRFLPSEIKLAFDDILKNVDDDDDNDGFRPSAPLRTRSVDCSPRVPRRSSDPTGASVLQEPRRVLSHEPWQGLGGTSSIGAGRWDSSVPMKDPHEKAKEAKEYGKVLETRLAEIGEREKLQEESQALRKERDDLEHRAKSLELQLEEELKTNIDLRRRLLYHDEQQQGRPQQKQQLDVVSAQDDVVAALRREVDILTKLKKAMDVKLKAAEKELQHYKGSPNTSSNVDSMSSEELRVELVRTRMELGDRDSAISNLTKEITALKEKLKGSMRHAKYNCDTDQEVIETLENANETLKRALELERIGTDQTVKSKDETIKYLMHELGRLEAFDADGAAGPACNYSYLSSPGGIPVNQYHKDGMGGSTISPTCVADF